MLHTRPWRESSAVWAWLAYWLARSECTSNPAAGCRLTMARFNAVQTNSAGILGAMAQPTILRENRSSTTAGVQPAAARADVGGGDSGLAPLCEPTPEELAAADAWDNALESALMECYRGAPIPFGADLFLV